MDHTSKSPSNGVAGAAVPRVATRKPLSARISQIEAKIQSAGGQVVSVDARGVAGNDASAMAARDAQYDLFKGCNDVEKLRAMALSVLKELEEARMENQDLTQSLRYVRSQLAETKLRAESAEATVSELEGKVQNLGVRLEQLQKATGAPISPSPSNPDIPKSSYLKRMPSTSSRASQIGPFNSSPSETHPPRYSSPSLGDLLTPIGSSIQQAAKTSAAAGGNISPKRGKSPTNSSLSPVSENSSSEPLSTPIDSSLISSQSIPPSSQNNSSNKDSEPNTTGNDTTSSNGPSSSDHETSVITIDVSSGKEVKSKDKRGKKQRDKPNRDSKNSSPRKTPHSASTHSHLVGTSSGDDGDLTTESGESPTSQRLKGVIEDDAATSGLSVDASTDSEKRRSNPFKRSLRSAPGLGDEGMTGEGQIGESTQLAVAGPDSGAKDATASPPTTPKTRKDRSMSEASSSSQGKSNGRNSEKSSRGGLVDDSVVGLNAVGSSASVASTASTVNAGEDKLMRRTSTSSISSASGDYSSYGSASNVGGGGGKAKKLKSEKSLGKHGYERTASAAAASPISTPMKSTATSTFSPMNTRSPKSKVASEDIQTDVELNKSAVARNYRRGMSGDLESSGMVMSIVDPSTMAGPGKRRNSPSPASPSQIQIMSGSSSPLSHHHHHPRNLAGLHANSVGNHIGPNRGYHHHSPNNGRVRSSTSTDAASATDHEGEYHTESTEAKFRALEKKRRQQQQGQSETAFGVAFGVRRGACEPPCECDCYHKKSESYACDACGHFPAQHEDLGKVSDDEEELNLAASSTSQLTKRPSSASNAILNDSKDDSTTSMNIQDREGMDDSIGAQKRNSGSMSSSSTLVSTTISGLDDAPVIDAHWLLNFSDCYFINQLGKGNSSTVFLGEYQGQQVAIKVLRQETHKRDLDDFKKEMEIMCSLRSPYIVHFFGATVQPKLCIVLEYCSRGTLFHYLHDDLNYVDWTMALRWLIESARGINTLHLWKPQIVHRDLKTLNLLLDEKMQVKVCDFGLSRYVSGEHDQSTFFKMRGTFAYFAPEVYQGKPFTSKSDVYSFGIILWEIIHRIIFGTHTRPFAEFKHINHDFQIIIQAAKGLRPTLPFSTPRILVKLYEDCVASDPDARPTCAEIIERLEGIATFYDQHMDTWDALVKGGVRIRPTPTMSRRDSQASPSRGSRAELLRTPIASRNLKDDLTRRGVTATLLREKSLSASSSGYGTDTTVSTGSQGFGDRSSRASIQLVASSASSPNSSPKPTLRNSKDVFTNSSDQTDSTGGTDKVSHPQSHGETNADVREDASESLSLTASSNSVTTGGVPGDRTSVGLLDSSGHKEGGSSSTANNANHSSTSTTSPPSPSPIEKKARSASAAPAPNSPSSSPKRNASPNSTKRKKKVFDATSMSGNQASSSSSSTATTDTGESTSTNHPDTVDTETATSGASRERTPSPTPISTDSPTTTPTKKKRTNKTTSHIKRGSEVSSGEGSD